MADFLPGDADICFTCIHMQDCTDIRELPPCVNRFERRLAMQWIKTTDRLPERNPHERYSQVACLVVHKREVKILVYNHEHLCWDDESADDYYCDIADVSYWQPLPEPPTAEDSGVAENVVQA